MKTDVLVVGAGPVGMFTALGLVEAGLRVTIIDRERRPATHSYACGLHPYSLELLARHGLLQEVLERGRRLHKVAFYSRQGRAAEVALSYLATEFPFVLVCPQDALEHVLATRLAERGCEILWHHRLSGLQPQEENVLAEVDRLVGTGTGSAVPRWEWVVGRTIEIEADYVVGADGHHSLVRRLLGIENDHLGPRELYVVYEFAPQTEVANELSVAVVDGTKSVLWPLPGGRCRWSFQLAETENVEFAEKDRAPFWGETPVLAQRTWERLQERLAARVPWYAAGVRELGWAVDIQFQNRLAQRYGRDRCWLVGDAAHQTAPAGIQSMNVGLLEAVDLAGGLARLMQPGSPAGVLDEYSRKYHEEWRLLLGAKGLPTPGPTTPPWAKEHRAQVLSSLPVSGEHLKLLLGQLGLTLP